MASSNELSPITPNAAFDFASADAFTSEATAADIISSNVLANSLIKDHSSQNIF